MKEKKSRSEYALNNAFLGFVNKIINIIFPFVIRTLIIYALGIQYAGLNGVFSSILQVLNLAELGISSAVVYCMYRPMAEDDVDTICALLRHMRKIYAVIGISVGVIGCLLIPLLPLLVSGTVPDGINLTILYLIYLVNTVSGYFFFSFRRTLLNAGQRVGTIQIIDAGITLLQGILQILVLFIWKNYYLFLVIMPVCTLAGNLWVAYASKKEFPQIVCRGQLSTDIKQDIYKRVKGLFLSRISVTTRNAFDSIFISSFIGLTAVGIYGNYYYISSSVTSVLQVLTTAMLASVGNSLATESVRKNYDDLCKFNFVYNWGVGYCTACLMFLYQPFMSLWMGKEFLFPDSMVILFCGYFYMMNISSIRALYHDAAGLWWEARYRAVAEAVLNIVLNILLTYTLGVFGTILGTLISMIFINYIYGTHIVFKYYFIGISPKQYYLDNFLYILATIFICILLGFVFKFCTFENLLVTLLVRGIIITLVFNLLYYLLFRQTKLFQQGKELVRRFVKR